MKLVRYGAPGAERPGLWLDATASEPARILDVRGMAFDMDDYDARFWRTFGLDRLRGLLLEKNLKRYVKWDVNLFGRKLQFMHGMSFVNFSKIRLQYPSSEPEIPDLTVPTGPRNPGDEELKPAPWN